MTLKWFNKHHIFFSSEILIGIILLVIFFYKPDYIIKAIQNAKPSGTSIEIRNLDRFTIWMGTNIASITLDNSFITNKKTYCDCIHVSAVKIKIL